MQKWSDLGEEVLADVIRRRGIDPATVPVEPPPFDPDAYRVEQAELVLSAITPYRFRTAATANATVARWVDAFVTDPRGVRSIVLAGEPGTGKTWTAYAILRAAVLEAARRRVRVTYRAVTHPDLNQMLRPATDGSHERALDVYMDADLLILDDLGAGKQTEWTIDNLLRLVDHRWKESLATVYTTNVDGTLFEETIGKRVASRVFDSQRLILTGPDRRRAGQ